MGFHFANNLVDVIKQSSWGGAHKWFINVKCVHNSFRSENITWCAWSVTKKGSCLSHENSTNTGNRTKTVQDTKILIEHALTVQFTYQSMDKPKTSENHTQHAINVEASSSRSIEKYLSFQLCIFFISTTEWYSPTSFIMTPWYILSLDCRFQT